jgi:hypothetical protein
MNKAYNTIINYKKKHDNYIIRCYHSNSNLTTIIYKNNSYNIVVSSQTEDILSFEKLDDISNKVKSIIADIVSYRFYYKKDDLLVEDNIDLPKRDIKGKSIEDLYNYRYI